MKRLAALAVLLGCLSAARATELVFIAPTNLTEPIARFVNGQLQDGVLRELGDALARRLGLQPRYLSLPGLRVAQALRNGQADMVCYVLPAWLDGDFHWTVPVLPNAEVVAARPGAAPVRTLADLAGQRVGTVHGYRYTHMLSEPDQPLPFERFDAPDTRANLAKLALGRMDYAIAEELSVRDYVRRQPESKLEVAFTVLRYTAQCALSKASAIEFERVNQGLSAMVREGEVRRILARYGS